MGLRRGLAYFQPNSSLEASYTSPVGSGSKPRPLTFFLFFFVAQWHNILVHKSANYWAWGLWLDEPQGQNIGVLEPSGPTKSAFMVHST